MIHPERQNIGFCIKVWLTTVIVPPMIVQVYNKINHVRRGFDVALFSIDLLLPYAFGFLFSVPYFIVFIFIVRATDKSSLTLFKRKLIITAIHLICILLIFKMIFGRTFDSHLVFISVYLIITSIAVLAYKLEGAQKR